MKVRNEAIRLRRAITFLAMLTVFCVRITPAFADQQYIDVLLLRDGTQYLGLVIDQNLGNSVKLVTVERTLLTFEQNEIERIEKRETEQQIPVTFNDVIVLKDGVIFRGMIMEQRPGVSLVLKTCSGILLTFPCEDIWAILKQRTPVGLIASPSPAQHPAAAAAVELAITLEQRRLRDCLMKRRGGGLQGNTDLEQEVSDLKEEMERLQEEKENVEQEALDLAKRSERANLEALQEEIEGLLKELDRILKKCEQTPRETRALPEALDSVLGIALTELSSRP